MKKVLRFTLIELLIVVAIFGIVLSIVIPAALGSR
jgi:prepilin-type N-terminal cleavage/methylation domain-containing protein